MSLCFQPSVLCRLLALSAAPTVCPRVRYQGSNCRSVMLKPRQLMTHSATLPPSINAVRKAYSITSSASATRFGGAVRPRLFAVLRLMTNSNLVGCSTGRSGAA